MSLTHRLKSVSSTSNGDNDSRTIRKGSSDSPSHNNNSNYNNNDNDKYYKIDQQQSSSSSATTATTPLTSPSRGHSSSTTSKTATAKLPQKKVQPLFRRTYSQVPPETPTWVYITIIIFIIITFITIPQPFHPEPGMVPSVQHVFYYGWLTCISTGLGAIPFYLFPDVATFWIGISNGMCFYALFFITFFPSFCMFPIITFSLEFDDQK
jgi:hypothetical protein